VPTCAAAATTARRCRTPSTPQHRSCWGAISTPNRKWVADLTRILTLEGVLWSASARDAFSNKVVGRDSGPRATAQLVCSALDYAMFSREVRAGQLIFPSDKGCQFTSLRFTQRLVDAGVAPWIGSVGDSFGNALAENLCSTLKVELIYWPATTFATRVDAQSVLFAASTDGTTAAASKPDSTDSRPTSTRLPGRRQATRNAT
jgi:transposase InsO family protein